GHLAHPREREQRLARVVALLVADEAQVNDGELRRDRLPKDPVVEDGERRGGGVLARGLLVARRDERAYHRRQPGLERRGDELREDLLELIGCRRERFERARDR